MSKLRAKDFKWHRDDTSDLGELGGWSITYGKSSFLVCEGSAWSVLMGLKIFEDREALVEYYNAALESYS